MCGTFPKLLYLTIIALIIIAPVQSNVKISSSLIAYSKHQIYFQFILDSSHIIKCFKTPHSKIAINSRSDHPNRSSSPLTRTIRHRNINFLLSFTATSSHAILYLVACLCKHCLTTVISIDVSICEVVFRDLAWL